MLEYGVRNRSDMDALDTRAARLSDTLDRFSRQQRRFEDAVRERCPALAREIMPNEIP